MTEDGVKNNDPLIIQIKSQQRDSIKFLHDLYHSLALEILQKQNSNNPQYVSHYQNSINLQVSKINDLLTKHERKSVKKFTYENSAEMMKTQLILIKLSMLLQQSY